MHLARRLPLESLCNARDLGGYATADGGVTRFGVYVRSEAPCCLPASDVDRLRDYGVRLSVDLRGLSEIALRPSCLPPRIESVACPLEGDAESFVLSEPVRWDEIYIRRAENNRPWTKTVLELAARQDGCLLFHCTTGKDRTGLIACFLLAAAGVSREDIAADYCVSEVYLQPVFRDMRRGAVAVRREKPDFDETIFHTPASAMLALQDCLTARYGSVVGYLRTAGVGDDTLAAIREKFVSRGSDVFRAPEAL